MFKSKSLVCMMYHNVFLEKTEGIICKDEFEKHMSYAKDKKSFKMEEVEKLNFRLPENSMLVTFDDGYKNTYTVAYPILKKYNIKATIFLNTKYINNDDAYLTWDEIREMYNSGLVDFQMHTHSHCPVIRKLQVKGFFDENVNEFVRRESLSIYKNGLIGKEREKEIYFKDFDFEGLPIFKVRSQIAIKGMKLKEGFIEKYREIEKNKEFQNMSVNERKKYLNNIFSKRKNEFFEEYTQEEFDKRVESEIKENKKQIEENLDKKVSFLAYPWGHRYTGDIKKLEDLGVKNFVLTTETVNNRNMNNKKICRINGDDFKEYDKFLKEMKLSENYYLALLVSKFR